MSAAASPRMEMTERWRTPPPSAGVSRDGRYVDTQATHAV